jgi:glycyl-tRNA synthetase beta chain
MGLREDVMEAVTRIRPTTMADLGDLLSRMRALQGIVSQPDFETLMIGFKRAHRIVEKEAWNNTEFFSERFQHESEHRLAQLLDKAQHDVADFVDKQQYSDALHTLLTFKAPIDDFFAAVLVNDSDPHIRENRLSLLTAIDRLFLTIANFSYIQSAGAEVG